MVNNVTSSTKDVIIHGVKFLNHFWGKSCKVVMKDFHNIASLF